MEKKASVRYKLQLSVNESHIPMKPYIVNTLGDVICGLLRSLSGVGNLTSTQSIFLEMDPQADEDHRQGRGGASENHRIHKIKAQRVGTHLTF